MMNFRSAFSLLLFAFSSFSSAKLHEVDNNDNVNVRSSLKGVQVQDEAAAAATDEEHRNLKKTPAKKSKLGPPPAAADLEGVLYPLALYTATEPPSSPFTTAFEILDAAAEVAAKLEQACCVSCNQGASASNICAGLFELECVSPIAQVIGDCLEKLCTCEFRQCALELLIREFGGLAASGNMPFAKVVSFVRGKLTGMAFRVPTIVDVNDLDS